MSGLLASGSWAAAASGGAFTMSGAVARRPAPPSAWAFHLHPVTWIILLGVTALYASVIRRPAYRVSSRQAWSFLGGIGVLLVALTWPVADIAAHRLLLALVLQRLILILAAPPLLIAGLPATLVARMTRPVPVDTVVRTCSRPIPAIIVVTVVGIGTLTTGAVDTEASSVFLRGGLDLAILLAGFVLWLPVLHPLPGADRLSSIGRAGYLIVQSIVPSFLAIVWIFARHPLYTPFASHGRFLGMSPVLDQQLAGFLAKLGTIAVLWTVAFVTITRSERAAEDGVDPTPLTWADVERQLERVERRERRAGGPPHELAGGGAGPSGQPAAQGMGQWGTGPGAEGAGTGDVGTGDVGTGDVGTGDVGTGDVGRGDRPDDPDGPGPGPGQDA